MSGHGWVTPNLNGVKARCGGPALCSACAKDLAANPKFAALKAERDSALKALLDPIGHAREEAQGQLQVALDLIRRLAQKLELHQGVEGEGDNGLWCVACNEKLPSHHPECELVALLAEAQEFIR